MQILGNLLIGRNFKWSVLIGRALIATRGRHGYYPVAGREQSRDLVSTVLIGREPSRDL